MRIVLLVLVSLLLVSSRPVSEPSVGTPGQRLKRAVLVLSSPRMLGRHHKTPGLNRAAKYIRGQFRSLGLRPPKSGRFFQTFRYGSYRMSNVIGILPGSGKRVIVIGGHYDHLGRSKSGRLYRGADDNASGIAVIFEIVRRMKAVTDRRATLIFVAFAGEEEGLLGSRYFVRYPPLALKRVETMINLDMVGQLFGRPLIMFGIGTSARFPPAIRRAARSAGLRVYGARGGFWRSDVKPFYQKKIPVLFLHTGLGATYHKTTDVPARIDFPGMERIADFASRLVRELVRR